MLLAGVWQRLFSAGIPFSEKIVRTVAVYLGLLFLLRLGGKRTAAQLNSFDLVVLLLISNVVQNAIIGPDNSLLGGLIGATALVIVNDLISRIARRIPALDQALEGGKTPLVLNGEVIRSELRRLGIGMADLEAALRRQGAETLGQIEVALLYPSGSIVVDLRPEARDASRGDIDRLERKVDELVASVQRLAQAGS
jgi:uncharacterized membrane protein YcaP (DUF421 family)